jgi:hypothetical protein
MSHSASRVTALIALCAALAAAVGAAAPRPRILVRERAARPTVRLGSQRPDGAVVIVPQEAQLPEIAPADQGHEATTTVAAGSAFRSIPVLEHRWLPPAPTLSVGPSEPVHAFLIIASADPAPGVDRGPPPA